MAEENIGRLLVGCLSPNEASTASQDLKRALADCTAQGHKFALQTLGAHALRNDREDVRQLASVLLRRRIAKGWTCLSPAEREEFYTALTERLVAEPSDDVRSGLAHVCATIAKRDFATRGETLLTLLNRLFASPLQGHRQVGFIILGCLLDTNMNDMLPHYADVVRTFSSGLADLSSSAVLSAMLRAIITAVEGCETEHHFQLLRQITPPLLALVKTATEKGLHSITQSAMDCLCEVVQAKQIIQDSEMPFVVFIIPTHTQRLRLLTHTHARLTHSCLLFMEFTDRQTLRWPYTKLDTISKLDHFWLGRLSWWCRLSVYVEIWKREFVSKHSHASARSPSPFLRSLRKTRIFSRAS